MAKPPRPTARTTRKPAARSRLGLPEKPDAASRRLRTRREPAEEKQATAGSAPTTFAAEGPAPDEPAALGASPTDQQQAKFTARKRRTAAAPAATPPEPGASSSPSLTPDGAAEAADVVPPVRKKRGRKPADIAPKSGGVRKARADTASPVPTARERGPAVAPPLPDETAPAEAPAVTERSSASVVFAAAPAGGLGIAGALGEELAAFSRQLIEDSSERARELAAARSLTDLIEIQTRQLQAVSDAWLQHSTRMRAIYLDALQNARDDDRR